jgi:hypothetical protein
LALNLGSRTWEDFQKGLTLLVGKTAWTRGTWDFGPDDQRLWNSIQNTPTHTSALAHYLLREMRKSLKTRIE